MTTQGQKTPFQGKKRLFCIFLSKNGCFLVLAGLKHLLRNFELMRHMCY